MALDFYETKTYYITCDKCSNNHYEQNHDDKEEMIGDANADGWAIVDDEWACPECAKK